MTGSVEKLRNLIQDNLKTNGNDIFTYETTTSSKVFTLTESNISTDTILVYKNGVLWASANYSFANGDITVTGTLAAGDSLRITYSYYTKYSDTEMQGFIKGAISYVSVEAYKTFAVSSDNVIFPTPSEKEENLLAIIAHILVKGDVISYRTPELTIAFERGDSKEKKIKKFIRQCNKSYGILDYIDLTHVVVISDEDCEDC